MMRFHGYWRSSAAYRCRIAFNLKGVDYDFAPVHLRRDGGEQKSEAYRALNPQALVPALEHEGRVLTQSLAIIEWLDETYPDPPLLPASPWGRAQVRACAQAIACDIHPLQNLRVLDYLKAELGHDQEEADAWCRKWIGDGLAACEALLGRGGRTHLYSFGDHPSLADICLAPQFYAAERFGVILGDMPRLRALASVYSSNEAFMSAHPANQPDRER